MSKKEEVKKALEDLEQMDVDSLSDEDLEDVAGGCSMWCCSNDSTPKVESV